jgi:hypothetical protein
MSDNVAAMKQPSNQIVHFPNSRAAMTVPWATGF